MKAELVLNEKFIWRNFNCSPENYWWTNRCPQMPVKWNNLGPELFPIHWQIMKRLASTSSPAAHFSQGVSFYFACKKFMSLSFLRKKEWNKEWEQTFNSHYNSILCWKQILLVWNSLWVDCETCLVRRNEKVKWNLATQRFRIFANFAKKSE